MRQLFFLFGLVAFILSGVAQAARPVSGVIAASSAPVPVSFTNEDGADIGRLAGIGDPIYLNDEISTGADTSLQILLKDQTVFSIGPNSQLVFDEFIFDPSAADQVSLSASVTKGSFKFISGKISKLKPGAMKLKLPNATASIRGTSVAGRVGDNGASDIVLLTGAIQLSGVDAVGSVPIDIVESGWGISVTSGGELGTPEPYSLEDIASIIDQATVQQDGDAGGAILQSEAGSAEEIAEVEALLLNAVEIDGGDVSAADLITQILKSDELIKRFAANDVALEVLQDSLESNVVVDTDLIAYLIGGGSPLWFYYDGTNGPSNPVPNTQPFANDRAIYDANYADLVSTSYAGSARFIKDNLALAPSNVTNGDTGSGTANFDITLDYGTAAVTGSFSTSDIILNGVNVGAVSTANAGTTVSNTAQTSNVSGLMDGLPLLTGAQLTDGSQVEFIGSFGSITNGVTTEDGTLGGFEVNIQRAGESDPSLKGEAYLIGELTP